MSEIMAPGFILGRAVCGDGSDPGAIGLSDGETVTRTFTNRMIPDEEQESGNIIVVKEALADGSAGDFKFGPSWGLNFLLSDGDSHDSGPLTPGSYSMAEVGLPAGWSLESAVWGDGSDPGAIGLSDGETVTCTF